MRADLKEKRQRSTIYVALLLFNLVLILLQLWLFSSVLEAFVRGESSTAMPAMLASVALFLVNLWMLRGLLKIG